jgi:hypothetical protein
VLSEAWRDLVTGTSRALIFSLALVAAVGAAMLADTRTITDVLANAVAFQTGGGAVHILDAHSVDGQRCDAIGHTAIIAAAGAIRPGQPVTALAMPSTTITVHDVTPGLFDVLTASAPVHPDSDSTAPGMWVTADLADTLGLTPGSTLNTATGDIDISGVFSWPDDGRDRLLGFSLLAPVPASGTFVQCLTSIWPVDSDANPLLLYAVGIDTADTQPRLSQLNASMGATFDVATQLHHRPTGWAPLAASVAGLVVGYAALATRRLEIAAALHARLPRPHLAWVYVLQTTAWTLAAAIILTAIAAFYTRATGLAIWHDVFLAALRIIASGCLTPPIGALLATATTREKHLFHYFKNRA